VITSLIIGPEFALTVGAGVVAEIVLA